MIASSLRKRVDTERGIGGMPIYLIDRYAPGGSIYDIDFEFLPDVDRRPQSVGLTHVDHLTHNVYRGIFDSIYFFDPNGHRLELACNKGGEEPRARGLFVRIAPVGQLTDMTCHPA